MSYVRPQHLRLDFLKAVAITSILTAAVRSVLVWRGMMSSFSCDLAWCAWAASQTARYLNCTADYFSLF